MPGSVLAVVYDTSTGKYLVQKVGTGQISDSAITSALIGSGQIGPIHFAPFTSGQVVLGQGTATPIYAFPPAGVPGDESITSAKLASGAVIGDRIAYGAVLSGHIGASIIGAPHIAAQAVTSGKIGANVIATPHIANQGILSASIGAGVVGDALLTNWGVISGKIASGVITEQQLVSGISIDIAEMGQEPTYRAQVPVSGFLAIQFSVSGYYAHAQAADIDTMPAVGLTTTFVNSGQIGAFQYQGRITNAGWNFSGYIGNLLFVGTSSEVTLMVSGLMISGRCVQRLAKVADADTVFLAPELTFAQIAE